MNKITFSTDEYDLFTELLNVAMGVSAAELAKLFGHFVDLKVPSVSIKSSESIPRIIVENSMFSEFDRITLIKQKFSNSHLLKGEGAIILNENTQEAILPLLDLNFDDLGSSELNDFLLELSEQLIGSCLSNLFRQFFDSPVIYESPEIVYRDETLRTVAFEAFNYGFGNYRETLCSKIDFLINDVNFQCDFFFFLDTHSLTHLQEVLQKILKESFE